MANQYISGQLKTNGPTGVVDAEDIAYSYKTEGGIELIDKSLKDKIDELAENSKSIEELDASKVKYTYIDNGVEKSTSLTDIIERIDTDTIDNAVDRANDVISLAASLSTDINTQVDTLDAKLNTISESIANKEAKIDKFTQYAEQLHMSFDADSAFKILSLSEYDNLVNKDPGIIYFCYDNE